MLSYINFALLLGGRKWDFLVYKKTSQKEFGISKYSNVRCGHVGQTAWMC